MNVCQSGEIQYAAGKTFKMRPEQKEKRCKKNSKRSKNKQTKTNNKQQEQKNQPGVRNATEERK